MAVAACAGAFGAYESYQQSGESDALLAENVEALSNVELVTHFKCLDKPETCYVINLITIIDGRPVKK